MTIWTKQPKTKLTPQEVLQVAHGHLICGIDQHHLAAMYGVNAGRIAEAVTAMRTAAENHMQHYHAKTRRLVAAKASD